MSGKRQNPIQWISGQTEGADIREKNVQGMIDMETTDKLLRFSLSIPFYRHFKASFVIKIKQNDYERHLLCHSEQGNEYSTIREDYGGPDVL